MIYQNEMSYPNEARISCGLKNGMHSFPIELYGKKFRFDACKRKRETIGDVKNSFNYDSQSRIMWIAHKFISLWLSEITEAALRRSWFGWLRLKKLKDVLPIAKNVSSYESYAQMNFCLPWPNVLDFWFTFCIRLYWNNKFLELHQTRQTLNLSL